ncbi:MAG: tRNA preQ1(34) S-adenosylmethionine ribosyltransferase-isomerase QueA [Acidobacteria bacterium]|nr:MAG: tRNA preQ1(34) S-adenosylmethionine ribosyltransferase-isomerase QueA [Acidobacteriota bacterium]
MRTRDFDYALPPAAIAQRPAPRGTSRLLVLDAEGEERHRRISDLPDLLEPGDLLVVNDTRVIPARLLGRRLPGGGRVELLLVAAARGAPFTWEVLMKPARRLSEGTRLVFGEGAGRAPLEAVVAERDAGGRGRVRFADDPLPRLDELGHVPLPPYVKRPDDPSDRHDYQTIFARRPGAVAAPTAGLHFTPELLHRLETRGIERTALTLHVGIGTFQPVTAERVEQHRMGSERYEISAAAAEAIARTRRRGGRVVAVGTTVVRTLETAARDDGTVAAGSGVTELFIYPGFRFRVVDWLLTNFHLPRSTLLMLVSAFAGRRRLLAAYREAIERGYRFYSYGDAMLASRRP